MNSIKACYVFFLSLKQLHVSSDEIRFTTANFLMTRLVEKRCSCFSSRHLLGCRQSGMVIEENDFHSLIPSAAGKSFKLKPNGKNKRLDSCCRLQVRLDRVNGKIEALTLTLTVLMYKLDLL